MTAIEELIERLTEEGNLLELMEIDVKPYLELEKQQIIDAYKEGVSDERSLDFNNVSSEQYYNNLTK